MSIFTRGFKGRRRVALAERIPPGQYVTPDFPVLTAGPTPTFPEEADWRFTIRRQDAVERTWDWKDFNELPRETVTVDIHCVTGWSKLDTTWQGVSLDTLLRGMDDVGTYALFNCYGGYTTNLPIADVVGGKAWIAIRYDGEALPVEHGGPARLLVPHLYFWKSAKWVSGVDLSAEDRPGFWETLGYHGYGDPWREQRYAGD